jgi:hypothetical protein
MTTQTNCTLGGTIPLPGYANIKIEVSAEGYMKTKEYLRIVLLQMCNNQQTATAIATWWFGIFNENIQDQI